MSEIGELSSRNLFSGMFCSAAVHLYPGSHSPWPRNFRGASRFGVRRSANHGRRFAGRGRGMERIDAAITPLLDKARRCGWVALQGLATVSDYQPDIKISPEVTTIKMPGRWADGGCHGDGHLLTTKEAASTVSTREAKDREP